MASTVTMSDIAYKFLSKRKKEVEFLKIWEEVVKEMEIPENKLRKKKSQFYSELMLDPRFASLENNKWDLRNRRKFEEVYVDTSQIEIGEDEEEEIEVENEDLDLPKGDDAFDN